jgi:hypothetical protein
MERPVSIHSGETLTATPVGCGRGFSVSPRNLERAVCGADRLLKQGAWR